MSPSSLVENRAFVPWNLPIMARIAKSTRRTRFVASNPDRKRLVTGNMTTSTGISSLALLTTARTQEEATWMKKCPPRTPSRTRSARKGPGPKAGFNVGPKLSRKPTTPWEPWPTPGSPGRPPIPQGGIRRLAGQPSSSSRLRASRRAFRSG